MNDTLNTDIQESIKKNLPLQIGEALQKELSALAQLRATDAERADALTKVRADCAATKAALAEKTQLLSEHAAIDKRIAEVTKRELLQDLRDLEVKLFNQRHTEMLQLVSTVFRSPVFTTAVNGSVPVVVPGSPGGNGTYATQPFVMSSPVSTQTTQSTN